MFRPAPRPGVPWVAALLLALHAPAPAPSASPLTQEPAAKPVALRTVAILDRATLEAAGVRAPERLAYGADGTLFVLDAVNRRVVALDPRGRERFAAGGYGSDDASLSLPADLAIDPRGSLLVLDRGRGAIVAYDAAGRFVASRALEGEAFDEARSAGARLLTDRFGDLWLLAPAARDLIALDGRLRPLRVARYLEPVDSLRSISLAAFLPSGEAWVCDSDAGALRRFASDGRHARRVELPKPGGLDVTDIAADASGGLLVGDRDGQRVLILDREGGVLLERVLGGPTAPWRPSALAAGPGGRLAVADADRDEIQLLEVVRAEGP